MKKIIYYISVLIIFLFSFYISGLTKTLEFLLGLIIYGTITYIFYIIYKKIRKKDLLNYKEFLLDFIQKISLSFVVIGILVGIFGYYGNYVNPAKMQEITISNGKKTVVFQEMSHIGTKDFYEKIKNNLINYKKNGFVYFYEGVKPGKKENMQSFNKAIGVKFDKELYKNFSKLYGVTFQNQKDFLGLVNNKDFNVDVGIDWIMDKYGKVEDKQTKDKKEIINLSSEITNKLAQTNKKELEILRFINKAILNTLIKSDKVQDLIQDKFANKKLFNIILDERNKVLSKEILNSKYNKIYITYGKLHFPGVFEILKQNDNNWKIINKKEFISIK